MVEFLTAAAGIGSILGGLGGLFGSKPKPQKQLTPYQAMESQVRGVRDHSAEYGFNPLTLLQYGATSGFDAGGGGGSAPPLASIQAITDGLKDLNDVASGDAARRRAADELELDLARVKLEQAKSGILPGFQAAAATSGLGGAPAPLGRRAAVVAQPIARPAPAKFSVGENPIAPGRKEDIAPLVNSPGMFEMENELTPFGPVTIPGEGEPWGLDELATGVLVGVPQVVAGGLSSVTKSIKDKYWDGKPFLKHQDDTQAERNKRQREEYPHLFDRDHSRWAPEN